MEIIGIIGNSIKGILGVLIPPIKKKYLDQPKIFIELKSNGVSKRLLGLSRKNNPHNDPLLIIDGNQAIHHFRLEWNYTLTLYNNSEFNGYNIKLIQPIGNSIIVKPPINTLTPLLTNSSTQYSITFVQNFEGKAEESNRFLNDHPEILKNESLIFEYTNIKETKFYTTFNFLKGTNSKNIFSRKIKI